MNQSNLKNMVVLRNLPSNIVEEAIVILKSNKKIREVEKIEKNKVLETKAKKNKENDYIVKEAEMLVTRYIATLEEKKRQKNITNKKINQKYIRLRNYALITSLIVLMESIALLIK